MPDRAIALYRQAETSDRAHWDTYRKATVRALLARKNIAEAQQAFALLDTASPDSDDVRLLRAALLVADNRAKDAIPQLQILIAHNAANCEAMVELARAYSSVGQQLMAESTLESCLRINPKYLPALREAARLYAAQNRNFEAEHAARAALAIAPRDAEARAVLENAHAAGAGGTP